MSKLNLKHNNNKKEGYLCQVLAKMWNSRNTCDTTGVYWARGIKISSTTLENCWQNKLNFKNTNIFGHTTPLLGIYPTEKHKEVLKNMNKNVDGSIIHNNSKLEIYTCSTLP